jgi:general secretion pathway protein A
MMPPRALKPAAPKKSHPGWEIRIPHQEGLRLPLVAEFAAKDNPPAKDESSAGAEPGGLQTLAGETYYGRFYGLTSPPFHITPDPSLLFATDTHQQALGAIEYGITAGKGFIVVTGEVGVGKTTVLKMVLERLDARKSKIIYLYNPAISVSDLYASILDGLDISLPTRPDADDTLRLLQRALLSAHQAGKQVILAVDEAQNMPEQTLENLRVLSNLETAKSKLLQIILVGQPELEAVLAKHSLRQLTQRVSVRARIKPLTFRQSCRYIQYRSQCAGRLADHPLFTAPALWYLALTARGTPRTINIACDNALINGYGYEAERVSLKIAREACRGLQLPSPLRRATLIAAAAALLICMAFSADTLMSRFHLPRAAVAGSQLAPAPPGIAPVAVAATVVPAAAAPPAAGSAPDAETAAVSDPAPPAVHAELQGPADAPASVAADSGIVAATAEPAPQRVSQTSWKWTVRRGDTIYRACRATYHPCDDQALRAIFAKNPQIRSDGIIYQGEVIIIPARELALRSN